MTDESVNYAVREQRIRSACLEIEHRIAAGQQKVVEEILRNDPSIASNSEQMLELVYAEVAASQENGIDLGADELKLRFPHLAVRLDRLLEVHHAFGENTFDSSSQQPSYRSRSDTLRLPEFDTIQVATSSPDVCSDADSHFVLGELIGRGATGTVYRATQRGLERPIAIKILRRSELNDEALVRFRREAAALASLQHPSIVQVYEVGDLDRLPFIAMELMTGGTLAENMAKNITSEMEGARLVAKLAGAIEHAHERGIVHRDLKPANILLTESFEPKIADFGLAQFTRDGDPNLTRTGVVLGTPAYMSPEQACGASQSTSPATDVYSLGAILYELLTGRCPFHGVTLLETLDQVRHQDPIAPRRLSPRLSRDLETICLTCLRKQPASRYASAAALQADLQRFIHGEPIQARRVSTTERIFKWICRRPLESLLTSIAITSALAGGAGVAWQWSRANDAAQTAISRGHAATLQQLVAERARDRAVTSEQQARRNFNEVQKLVASLVNVSGQLGTQPHADSIRLVALEEAYQSFSGFRTERSDDQHFLSLMNALSLHLGGVFQARHEAEPGRSYFAEAVRVADQLTSRFPENQRFKFLRGRSYFLQGIFLNQVCGEIDNARVAFRSSADAFESILVLEPNNSATADSLGIVLVNLAGVVPATGVGETRENILRRAIELQTTSLLGLPTVAKDRQLSEFIRSTSSQDLEYQPHGLDTRDGARGPISDDLAQRLLRYSLSLESRGKLNQRNGNAEKAIWNCGCGVALQQFVINYGTFREYHRHYLSRTNVQLARGLLDVGKRTDAYHLLESSLAVWKQLSMDYPGRSEYVQALLETRELLGKLAIEDRDLDGIESFIESVPRLHAIAMTAPGDDLGQELAWNRKLYSFDDMLRNAGYLAEAERTQRYCLQFRQELVNKDQESLAFAKDLSQSHYSLSSLLDLRARSEESREHISIAIGICQKHLQSHPHESSLTRLHWKALSRKAFYTWQDEDFDAAVSAGIKILEHGEEKHPSLNNLAWLLTMHPDRTKRQATFTVGLARQACALSPDRSTRWHTLATCLCRAQRYQEAQEAIGRSIELAGKDYVLNTVVLAMIQTGNGNTARARSLLVTCNPDQVSAPSQRQQLERLIAETREMLRLIDDNRKTDSQRQPSMVSNQ